MSKRLQVLLDEAEYRNLSRTAENNRMTVAAWVRQSLRAAGQEVPLVNAKRKMAAVRAAARYRFPTGDIETMLAEIESGYGDRKP